MSDKKGVVCSMLVNFGPQSMTAIKDNVMLTEHQAISLIGELAAKGVLYRDGNMVKIKDRAKAILMAEQAVVLKAVPPRADDPVKPKLVPLTDEVAQEIAAKVTGVRKDVPLPAIRLGRSYALHAIPWRFDELEIGWSFEVDVPDGVPAKVVAERLRKDADVWDRLHPPFKAAIRIAPDGKKVGLWRVEALPKKTRGKNKTGNGIAVSPDGTTTIQAAMDHRELVSRGLARPRRDVLKDER